MILNWNLHFIICLYPKILGIFIVEHFPHRYIFENHIKIVYFFAFSFNQQKLLPKWSQRLLSKMFVPDILYRLRYGILNRSILLYL